MTPRELKALSDVHSTVLSRWAVERAMFANAHFRGKGETAFTTEDFLGTGNRVQRAAEEAGEQMRVMQANAALARILPGAPPTDDIPSWAKD